MFTPFHILCNSNRITLWQTVICGIPSFQFEDFLFALCPSYIEKKIVSVFLSPWGLTPETLQVFEQTSVRAQIKVEQRQAWWSRHQGGMRNTGNHWQRCGYSTGQSYISQHKNIFVLCALWIIICCHTPLMSKDTFHICFIKKYMFLITAMHLQKHCRIHVVFLYFTQKAESTKSIPVLQKRLLFFNGYILLLFKKKQWVLLLLVSCTQKATKGY